MRLEGSALKSDRAATNGVLIVAAHGRFERVQLQSPGKQVPLLMANGCSYVDLMGAKSDCEK